MSLEDFLRQARGAGGRREATTRHLFSQAFEHARAVFGTLSEAVSRKEWFDIVVEPARGSPAPHAAGHRLIPQPAAAGGYAGQTVRELWPSEHLERLRVKGRRELRVQGGQVIAIQLDVERRAVLIHVIRPAGPRDGADAVLA